MVIFSNGRRKSLDNKSFLEGAGVAGRQPEHFSGHAQGLYGVKNTIEPKSAVPAEKLLCIYYEKYEIRIRSSGSYGYED